METIFSKKGKTPMLEYSTTLTMGSLNCINQKFLSTLEFISMHYIAL